MATRSPRNSCSTSGEFAAHGGAFPVIVRDVGVVGTVTVSGLPQEEDHRLVVAVLRAFLVLARQDRDRDAGGVDRHVKRVCRGGPLVKVWWYSSLAA